MATVWDGVFSQEQAAEGAAQYELSCSACHSADLRGSSTSPSLVGSGFLFFWQDKPLSELFTTIHTLMPTDAPNSLPTRTYLNILSYILEANEFPAGESDLLDPAALRRIIITAKS
jgi:mono/diheme cytochrome c family protein|tara:strand:+ start:474 stop:821 length:348 start_codon:yes stop_codon:yes gene_type:complete